MERYYTLASIYCAFEVWRRVDKTEAMIPEKLQDENVVLIRGGGTLQIHSFSVEISCTDTRLFPFLRCLAYTYSTMISVSDPICAMNPYDQNFISHNKKKTSRLESCRRFSAFGFVLYLNGKTAQKSRLCSRRTRLRFV